MSKEQTNLMEGLLDEILRVTDMVRIYKELPGGAGNLAANFMEISLKRAKDSIKNDDVVEMLQAYEELKTYEL